MRRTEAVFVNPHDIASSIAHAHWHPECSLEVGSQGQGRAGCGTPRAGCLAALSSEIRPGARAGTPTAFSPPLRRGRSSSGRGMAPPQGGAKREARRVVRGAPRPDRERGLGESALLASFLSEGALFPRERPFFVPGVLGTSSPPRPIPRPDPLLRAAAPSTRNPPHGPPLERARCSRPRGGADRPP